MSAVLVATDLGAGGAEAVRQAHRISVEEDVGLIVCHVIPHAMGVNMLFPQVNAGVDFSQRIERAAAAVRDHVVSITQLPADGFEVIVEEGAPEEVIVRSAETRGVQLVVVGGPAQGILSTLLGSATERVVRHAHVPVLVARETPLTGRVLVATDFSDPSLPAVERAVIEAERRRARLHIVHCVGIPVPIAPSLAVTGSLITATMLTEVREAAELRLKEALARFGASGDCHVIEGSPGPSIVQLADELTPDLLVLGTVGHTGLLRLALGSVAEHVVHHAKQSTLVVRLRAPK